MKVIHLAIVFFFCNFLIAQSYNITTGGQVSTCSGSVFDSGGAGGNYGNNESSTMTFCSSSSNCISMTFTELDLGTTNADKIRIYDGPTTAYAVMGNVNGTNEPAVPFTVTSTSGCLTIRFTTDGAGVGTGFTATIACAACPVQPSYDNPNGFIYNCNSLFFDNNGPATNYANNLNRTTKICSNSGNCVIANFTAFDTESGFDFLTIYDGSNITDPVIGTYSGVSSPGIVTSSSGCLTFEFASDGTNRRPGWQASITCGPCGVPPPPSPQNCSGAVPVCNDQAFSGNSDGSGSINDLSSSNDGCLYGENQTSWYYFQVATPGNIELNISPVNGTDDYDFALWGPLVSLACPPVGAPLRCSYAAGGGNTGLNNPSADLTEGAGGNRFVHSLDGVTTGQVYILLVDNFSESFQPFNLDWTMTAGASLDCTPLPIELFSFEGKNIDDRYNLITWKTASETNNDFFNLERSIDGKIWENIFLTKGQENSLNLLTYHYEDFNYLKNSINYYRLKQTDINGKSTYSKVIAMNESKETFVVKRINLLGQEITNEPNGIYFEIMNDNKIVKRFK